MAAHHNGDSGVTSSVLLIDDRQEAVAREEFKDAWRTWLRLANLLGPAVTGGRVQIIAHSIAEQTVADQLNSGAELIGMALPSEWREAAEFASPAERDLLTELAALVGIPVPEMGADLVDGIPVSMVWREQGVVVAFDLAQADRGALESDGWALVEPDPTAVVAALEAKE
jgi:hypothetical protein